MGHCTTTDAEDYTDELLVATTLAVFEYVAQLEDDGLLEKLTVAEALPARSPKLQVSTPPAIAQVPGPE